MSQHLQLLNDRSRADFPGITFQQAKHYRIGRRGFQPCYIVLHSAECAEVETAAEALQRYCATMADVDAKGRPRQASWHFAVDSNSTTQSVRIQDTAFHAPPLNDLSVGIEQAGYARQGEFDWSDDFSRRMLSEQLVPLLARISQRAGIALQTLSDDQVRLSLDTANMLALKNATGEEWDAFRLESCGVLTHAQVSRIFRKSDHHDPGRFYPLDDVVKAARFERAALAR